MLHKKHISSSRCTFCSNAQYPLTRTNATKHVWGLVLYGAVGQGSEYKGLLRCFATSNTNLLIPIPCETYNPISICCKRDRNAAFSTASWKQGCSWGRKAAKRQEPILMSSSLRALTGAVCLGESVRDEYGHCSAAPPLESVHTVTAGRGAAQQLQGNTGHFNGLFVCSGDHRLRLTAAG